MKLAMATDLYCYKPNLSCAIIIAILLPVAVTGNSVILAVIWKKTFPRTPSILFLVDLAFTELCLTRLIAQPLCAAIGLAYIVSRDCDSIIKAIDTTGVSIAIYFIARTTICLITPMSVERWLYMSR